MSSTLPYYTLRLLRRIRAAALLLTLPTLAMAVETTVSVGDTQVIANAPGLFQLPFVVTRGGDATDGIRLHVETAVGGANPAVPGDHYLPLPPGTEAVFAPGQTSTIVPVNVFGSGDPGPDQTLLFHLTEAMAFHPQPRLQPAGWHRPVRGGLPNVITAADLNGDGIADIVTGNALSLNVSILLSGEDGGFDDALILPLAGDASAEGFAPRVIAVALGDVTGNGHRDVIAMGGLYVPVMLDGVEVRPATVQVFQGDGAGGFAMAPITIPLPSTASFGTPATGRTALADVNGDGRLDIVATAGDSAGSSAVSILLGDGQGGFAPERVFALQGGALRALAVADVNGDRHPDIVAGGTVPNIQVLLGDGSGQFDAPIALPDGTGIALVTELALADVTGNGHLDIVAANSHSPNPPSPPYTHGSISVLAGDGSGGFAAATQVLSSPVPPGSLAVDDLTGNGHADIIFTRSDNRGLFSDYVGLLAGTGGGQFAAPMPVAPVGAAPSAVTIADVTGDGILDAITANATAGSISILPGDGNGRVGFDVHFEAGRLPHSLTAVDLNHDGWPDLVAANVLSHDISVLLGDGSGGFSDAVNLPAGVGPRAVLAADVDTDGHLDLVVANGGSGDVSVLFGDGAGNFTAATSFSLGGGLNQPVAIAAGDINGDGHLDIVAGNSALDASLFYVDSISLLLGDGTGGFDEPVTIALDPNLSLQSIALADVTGDGRLDIVTANSLPSTLSILVGDGSGGFSPGDHTPVGLSPVVVLVDDVTGDGHADLIALIHAEHSIAVLAGDGSGGFGAAATFPIHPETLCGGSDDGICPWPWGMVIADANGDGLPDIVTANTDNNSVSVLVNDGSGGFDVSGHFDTGSGPRAVAVADVDGDGNADVISANARGGSVSILRNDLSRVLLLDAEAVGTIITDPGPAPALVFDPLLLNFGDVEVGSVSPAQTLILHNNGEIAATALSFGTLSGGLEADVRACGDALPAAASCAISIHLAPTVPGPVSHSWTVHSDQGASALVRIFGNGTGGELPPRIGVDPSSLSVSLPSGEVHMEMLTVANLGAGVLHWGLVEGPGCLLPIWLGVDPIAGSIAGGQSQALEVLFDGGGLAPGQYQAELCLGSNDPQQPMIPIPVALTVETSGKTQADIGVDLIAVSSHLRPGQLQNYLISVDNAGPATADGVDIGSALAAELDADFASWLCLGPAGSNCTATGQGELDDRGLMLPASGSVHYLLSAPVRWDADGAAETWVGASYTHDPNAANNNAPAISPIVLFRDGFQGYGLSHDVQLPESADEPLGELGTVTLTWPESGEGVLESLLVAQPAGALSAQMAFRVDRLAVGAASWARLVTDGERGERASAWVSVRPGTEVVLALADLNQTAGGSTEPESQRQILLFAAGSELRLPLDSGPPPYRLHSTVPLRIGSE